MMLYEVEYHNNIPLAKYPENQKYLVYVYGESTDKETKVECDNKTEMIKFIALLKYQETPDQIELVCGKTGEVIRTHQKRETGSSSD